MTTAVSTAIDALDLDAVVSKTQHALYEYHFAQADPHDHGIVSSIEASNYLQRSHLKADQLKIIWNLADPIGRGYLDRRAFYIALKLIALAQNNLEFNDYSNITREIVPPALGGDIPQSIALLAPDNWTIGPAARCTFDRAFERLSGTMSKLPGSTVKPIFLKSGLSADQLHRIWELSDVDGDGALDQHEFAIAMFLIHGMKSAIIRELPDRLPTNLMPIRIRRVSGDGGPTLTNVVSGGASASALASIAPAQISPSKRTDDHWIVSAEDKQRFDILFQQLDQDKDGFISGGDVYQTFLASGLPNFVLSHIWNVCDIGQTGKFNAEQFALAAYFINLKLQAPNYQLPMELSHEMLPPSLRPKTFSVTESDNAELQQLFSEVNMMTSEKIRREIQFNEKQQAVKEKRATLAALELRCGTVTATLAERQQRMAEKQSELHDVQDRKEKAMKDIRDIEQQIVEENHLVEVTRGKINTMTKETTVQQQTRQLLTQIQAEKNAVETRLMNKQQLLAQTTHDVERYRQIVEQQRALIEEYTKNERQDSITELTAKFKQITDRSAAFRSPPTSKVASPKQQSQVSSPTSAFPDPFGLSANPTAAVQSFGGNSDPFGTVRPDDPFLAAAAAPAPSSSTGQQKLDEADPFRPVDFNAMHDLIKKSMVHRSKTPGANMFSGSNFTPSTTTATNRPQSAMAWEPTREAPPQPGTQAFNDLFDVFG